MPRAIPVAALLIGTLAIAACEPAQDDAAPAPAHSPTAPTPTEPTPSTTATATPAARGTPAPSSATPAAEAACMKPFALGNQSRSMGAISGRTSIMATRVAGMVVQADWNELEPGTPGRYDTSVLDKQIAYARDHGLTVRIRITAGTFAPTYVKKIGGAPIPFYDHQARQVTTIGRFWRTDYQSRWQALMSYLAARYDTSPTVREVNISGTGTISSEEMLTMGNDRIPGSATTNAQRLIAAGASEAQRRAALMADIAFMQETWKHTHTVLFAHPYVPLEPKPKVSLATTEAIVTSTYDADPGATVFGHTGASESTFKGRTHPNALAMYRFFIAKGYPFMAQTQAYSGGAKNEGVGDLSYVMTWLADRGASSIELPSGWQTDPKALSVLATTTSRMSRSSAAASAKFRSGC